MTRALMFYFCLLMPATLASCGPKYKVVGYLKEVPEGYACRSTMNGAEVKLCATREECNEYCDKMNKEDK